MFRGKEHWIYVIYAVNNFRKNCGKRTTCVHRGKARGVKS